MVQIQSRESEHRRKGLCHKYTAPGAKILPLGFHLLKVSPLWLPEPGDQSFTPTSILKSPVVGFSADAISQIKLN